MTRSPSRDGGRSPPRRASPPGTTTAGRRACSRAPTTRPPERGPAAKPGCETPVLPSGSPSFGDANHAMDPRKHGVAVHSAGGRGPYPPGRRAAVHEGSGSRRCRSATADAFERNGPGLHHPITVPPTGRGTEPYRPLGGSPGDSAGGLAGRASPTGARRPQGTGLRGICEARPHPACSPGEILTRASSVLEPQCVRGQSAGSRSRERRDWRPPTGPQAAS